MLARSLQRKVRVGDLSIEDQLEFAEFAMEFKREATSGPPCRSRCRR